MVDPNQVGLSKLTEASQYREKCEKHVRKIKRLRNLIGSFFAFSVVLIVGSNMFMEPPLIGKFPLPGFSGMLPTIETASLIAGIVSLALLLVSVLKSISLEMQANRARKTEGLIAQNLYRVVLLRSKGN